MRYYKKEKTEYGSYVDAEGVRYMVEWCNTIYSPKNLTPEQLGYEPYENQDEALEAWGLTPYVDPEAESLTIE